MPSTECNRTYSDLNSGCRKVRNASTCLQRSCHFLNLAGSLGNLNKVQLSRIDWWLQHDAKQLGIMCSLVVAHFDLLGKMDYVSCWCHYVVVYQFQSLNIQELWEPCDSLLYSYHNIILQVLNKLPKWKTQNHISGHSSCLVLWNKFRMHFIAHSILHSTTKLHSM